MRPRYLATYAQVTECLWGTSLPARAGAGTSPPAINLQHCTRGHSRRGMASRIVMTTTSLNCLQ